MVSMSSRLFHSYMHKRIERRNKISRLKIKNVILDKPAVYVHCVCGDGGVVVNIHRVPLYILYCQQDYI